MGDKIYVPYQEAESEFVEKRSRFIGHIWPVDSEDQAQELIRRVKKQHYDARHNCWCYLLGGTVVRYSDDGEPQGTAGQPMLAVFQREHVTNVLCVVTRYFGGILLGAGGLTRAYSKSARDALAAAGGEQNVETPETLSEVEESDEAGANGNTVKLRKIWAVAALIGVACFGGALGMAHSVAKAANNMAEQPEAAGQIRTSMMMGLVFIETVIIYALIIAILIIFVL